ncbi:MAG: hypothetical protein ACM3O8_10785, partial [Methylococcaceae bacterium]
MKKTCLLLVFLLSTFINYAQNPQGFFLDNWKPKTAVSPSYAVEKQVTQEPTVTLEVDFTNSITKVSPYLFGNNSIPWAGK